MGKVNESYDKYLIKKREKVLKEIKPICEVFNITEYDYEIDKGSEFLVIYKTKIGCSSNSISAILQELVGYLFIIHWRKRWLGNFDKQARNVIKKYWIE